MSNEVTDQRHQASSAALMLNADNLTQMYRAAEMMASARFTVPKHLVGSPGDCLAIIMQSTRWGMDPFAVAQKTHVVNGALGYEAQLVNAVVSSSSLLATRIAYEWEGDWRGVSGETDRSDERAVWVAATLRGENAPRKLRVSMAQAGVRNSPNWKHDPRQQLAYLATKRWARLHAPDVMLGVYTPDELAEPTEKHMGLAQEVGQPSQTAGRPALPDYTDADLEANLPAWAKAVASGRKSAPDLLAMLQTKANFSEHQKARILSLKGPGHAATSAATHEPGPPGHALAPAQAATHAEAHAATPAAAADDWAASYAAAEEVQP